MVIGIKNDLDNCIIDGMHCTAVAAKLAMQTRILWSKWLPQSIGRILYSNERSTKGNMMSSGSFWGVTQVTSACRTHRGWRSIRPSKVAKFDKKISSWQMDVGPMVLGNNALQIHWVIIKDSYAHHGGKLGICPSAVDDAGRHSPVDCI